ncbi:MAG: signal peptidase II [Pseudomonadota bacterium]
MTRLPFLAFSALLILLDQLSKWAITELVLRPKIYNGANGLDLISWLKDAPNRLSYDEITILPFFNLVMVWNEGVSFGLFSDYGDLGLWLLVALTAVIVIWFTGWLFMTETFTQKLAIAMVVGGAIGNIIDRLRFGAVIDFLDFHAFGWHYPAFNLADSCIVLGVLCSGYLYSFFMPCFLKKRLGAKNTLIIVKP